MEPTDKVNVIHSNMCSRHYIMATLFFPTTQRLFCYALEPNIFLQIAPIPIPCPSTTTYDHSCPPMLFKLRPCIKNVCNVHYPSIPSLGLIGQNKRSFIIVGFSPERLLVSVLLASVKFDIVWSWMHGCTKLNAPRVT